MVFPDRRDGGAYSANWSNYTIYWMFYGLYNFWDLITSHRDTDVAITRECFNS